jgi:hypothetical protein
MTLSRSSEPRSVERSLWGLRMADSIYKDQFIETETKMEEGSFRLLGAHGKSPLKY